VEADNLLPLCTQIWVVCTKLVETGEKKSFRSRDEFVSYVEEVSPTHVVFHNGLGFDLEALARVWDIPYTVGKDASWMGTLPVVWVDTLLISRFLNADRVGGHSLESYGERFGFAKGDHSDWSQFSEEMLTYCIRDVDLTEKVLEYLEQEMEEYG
jgi:DNA polymerase I